MWPFPVLFRNRSALYFGLCLLLVGRAAAAVNESTLTQLGMNVAVVNYYTAPYFANALAQGTGVGAPTLAVVTNSTDPLLSDRLCLAFTVPNPAPSDVTYLVQVTSDLSDWTTIATKGGTGAWD